METEQPKVKTMLASESTDFIFQQMIPAFSADTRFSIASETCYWVDFEKTLETTKPNLLVVSANISPNPDQLIKSLARLQQWNGVAIILIQPIDANLKPILEQVGTVRGVYTLPVNFGEVAQEGYSAVITERTKGIAQNPLQSAMGMRTATTITGTRTIAFISASGGVGRSTIAENFSYEFARTGAKTLLMSFDLPSPAPMHLNVRTTPNAGEFFASPKEGFDSCIQKCGDLHVIVSPDNSVDYARYATNEGENSIYGLVHASWNKQYAAIVMDLPNGEGNWMTQPLIAANTAVIVARPTLSDLYRVAHLMNLLTEKMNRNVQIPKDSIYLVVNQFTPKATFSPDQMQDELIKNTGWTPKLAGTIAYNENIPLIQDTRDLPVMKDDDFRKGISSIIHTLYPTIGLNNNSPKSGSLFSSLFGKK